MVLNKTNRNVDKDPREAAERHNVMRTALKTTSDIYLDSKPEDH
jgi:hypothetical protein